MQCQLKEHVCGNKTVNVCCDRMTKDVLCALDEGCVHHVVYGYVGDVTTQKRKVLAIHGLAPTRARTAHTN